MNIPAIPNTLRDAVAWFTADRPGDQTPSDTPWVWFWQAIQGDFNEDRSGKQLTVDAAISLIPLVDQLCDIRDLIANCRKLIRDVTDTWAWVSLGLSLIGLIPFLGTLLKSVLKIFFLFIRRHGGEAVIVATELAMTWVITFLRRRDVQVFLRIHHIDEVFSTLAKETRELAARVNVAALLTAFDEAIDVLGKLVAKVDLIPKLSDKAKATLEEVKKIRKAANEYIPEALQPMQKTLDAIAKRFENEALLKRYGRLDAHNIHFRGDLPEAAAVTLMRREPLPSWLDRGMPSKWTPADYEKEKELVAEKIKEKYPNLSRENVQSFHRLRSAIIPGPERLYRIISPSSRGMSDCWVTEKVFRKLQSQPDPRSAWRRYLAVWPHWNVNGQFVVYDIKRGESLKVWRGEAASQKLKKDVLDDRYLEGGWEQIVFNIERADARNDVVRQYARIGPQKTQLGNPIDYPAYNALSREEKANYQGIREEIKHPNISGPFETGWSYTDFDGAGFGEKLGLPVLAGQTTILK